MPSRLSRRSFLGGSVKAGLGVAGAGLALGGPMALLDGAAAGAQSAPSSLGPNVTLPSSPTTARSYVSRPDLHPPAVNITTVPGFPDAGSGQPNYLFFTPSAAPGSTYPTYAQEGLMILDLRGDVIWFQPTPSNSAKGFNFRVQTYNSKPVLTWFSGTIGLGFATAGDYIIADSSYTTTRTVKASNYPCDLHEFLLTPEGTALHTSYQQGVTGPDGPLIVGHAQEVDVATNDLVFDWPCYPTVSPSLSYTGTGGDYFHINSIDLWPGSARNLLISSRNTCAAYLIDRATKTVIWRLGGKASTFGIGPGCRFSYQHDARALLDGSGLSLFDDASAPSTEKQSWGKVISLDQTTKKATLRHQYSHLDAPVDAGSQGNVQLLPNGSHMVGWGAEPYFSIFRGSGTAIQGEQALDGRFPAGVDSYRSLCFDWVGTPSTSQLALKVESAAGSGHFTGFVSWNGATEVASWRMNAGSSSSTLDVVGTYKKGAFETRIPFTHNGAKAFQVAALNSSGKVLGRTPVVGVT